MRRGGWAAPVEGLADKVQALIKNGTVPAEIDRRRVTAAAEQYGAFSPEDRTLEPNQAARKIEKLTDKADKLASELARLPIEVSDALALAAARLGRSHVRNAMTDARNTLGHLAGALELARREIEAAPRRDRKLPSRRTGLVLILADTLKEAGVTVTARQSGPLVKLTEAILTFHGELPANVIKARGALKIAKDKGVAAHIASAEKHLEEAIKKARPGREAQEIVEAILKGNNVTEIVEG